jgi:hypothetical protein
MLVLKFYENFVIFWNVEIENFYLNFILSFKFYKIFEVLNFFENLNFLEFLKFYYLLIHIY